MTGGMEKMLLPLKRKGDSIKGTSNRGDMDQSRERLTGLLQSHFGHSAFRGPQLEAIQSVLSGEDCFCLMPTGGGKSLCFQIPALARSGIVLVVSPLIALMENQVSGLTARGIKATYLCSTRTAKVRNDIYEQLNSGLPSLRLLYVTPELIVTSDFMSKLRKLDARGLLSLIAIDEAHCISSWGHDFRPSYRKLSTLKSHFASVPILALTATASKTVREDVIKSLRLVRPRVYISSFNRPNISYEVRYKDLIKDPYKDLRQLLATTPEACSIIYCHSRANCDEVGSRLSRDRISSVVYHAGLGVKARTQALEDWASGKVPVVVATIAFGMGIDRRDVRLVCHFNVPKSLEGFYQESGRAGRDGMPARSVLYYGLEDRQLQQFLISKGDHTRKNADREAVEKAIEKNMASFSKMVDYCMEVRCRRQTVLAHFGEHVSTELCAKTCDVCKSPSNVRGNIEDLELAPYRQRNSWNSSYIVASYSESRQDNCTSAGDEDERESEDEISNSEEEEDGTDEARAAVSKSSRPTHVDRKIDALMRAEERFSARNKPAAKEMGPSEKRIVPQAMRDTAQKRLEGAVLQSTQRLNVTKMPAKDASVFLEGECFKTFGKAGKSFYNSHLASTIRWLGSCSASDLESRLRRAINLNNVVQLSETDTLPARSQPSSQCTPSGDCNGNAGSAKVDENERSSRAQLPNHLLPERTIAPLPRIPTFSSFMRNNSQRNSTAANPVFAPFKKPRLKNGG